MVSDVESVGVPLCFEGAPSLFQIPILFDLEESALILLGLIVLACLSWRQDNRRQFGKASLLPWRTISVLLWGVSFLVAIQALKQLPAYLAAT